MRSPRLSPKDGPLHERPYVPRGQHPCLKKHPGSNQQASFGPTVGRNKQPYFASVYHISSPDVFLMDVVGLDLTYHHFVTNFVSEVLLLISVFSSTWVIVMMSRWKNKGKLRVRMILGLFIAHLWTSFLVAVILAFALAGLHPQTGTYLCSVSAVLVCMAIWTEYLFTVALAVVTYGILLHPLSSITMALERGWLYIVMSIYTFSLGLAILQISLYGASYDEGFCFNKSEDAKVFNAVTAFVPRCLVFIIVTTLYIRIHIYLRRDDLGTNCSNPLTSRRERRLSRTIVACSMVLHLPAVTLAGKGGRSIEKTDKPPGPDPPYPTTKPASGSNNPPPWESVHLPAILQKSQSGPGDEGLKPAPTRSWKPQVSEGPVPSLQSPFAPGQHGIISQATLKAISRTPSNLPSLYNAESRRDAGSCIHLGDHAGYHRDLLAPGAELATGWPADGQRRPATNVLGAEKSQINLQGQNESIAHFLKRKAAILFLLFPLTYTILMAISLSRLINDFTSTSPSLWLHTVTRWSLFLQAPLDALTLFLAGRKVHRQMKNISG